MRHTKTPRRRLAGHILATLLTLALSTPAALPAQGTHDHAQEARELYQCPMHPQIVQDHPGHCPICGMELQPVKQLDAQGIPGRAPVQLTAQQEQLINVRVAPVVEQDVSQDIRAVGTITYDTTRVADVNARIMGWVEQLYVDKPAQSVKAGEPLMAIYSPELLSAQQEYLLAWKGAQQASKAAQSADSSVASYLAGDRQSTQSLLKAARRRLELWGISDAQIKALQQSGEAKDTLELDAPISGVVIEKKVDPGQMIQPGMKLYQLADLSQLWLNVDVYEYELPLVAPGQPVDVAVSAYPGRTFHGTVDFVYPYLQGKTRTTTVRVVLPNPDGALKPDMYATGTIHVPLGNHLTVPASAVFDTGRRQYVFVKQGEGTFIPTIITPGPRLTDRYVVQEGLAPGQEVVVDGNFLIDSESQLKAAASGSREEDATPPAKTVAATPAGHAMPAAAVPAAKDLVATYTAIHEALANDEADGLAARFTRLGSAAEELGKAMPADAAAMGDWHKDVAALKESLAGPAPAGLEAARVKFGTVSAALIPLFQHFHPPLNKPLEIVFCPMWTGSPARWLQVGEAVENPFYGQSMLTCGELKGALANH